ncbi:hypothetical protein GGQ92_002126 [Gracilibacillus halotolerans]|uniref:Uncharacterized protein n=1 Tax=Gracilibacillus halotolerans TaxID=74386 RepID=A0A841RLF7_9BACI|nr:hypothetical protein [Gracilibacillus halotolerans]
MDGQILANGLVTLKGVSKLHDQLITVGKKNMEKFSER